jgi:hypothetical protein
VLLLLHALAGLTCCQVCCQHEWWQPGLPSLYHTSAACLGAIATCYYVISLQSCQQASPVARSAASMSKGSQACPPSFISMLHAGYANLACYCFHYASAGLTCCQVCCQHGWGQPGLPSLYHEIGVNAPRAQRVTLCSSSSSSRSAGVSSAP